MAGCSNQNGTGHEPQWLLPLAVSDLSQAAPDMDLYVRRADSETPVLYRERTEPLLPEDIGRLLARGIDTLYMAASDRASYRQYADEQICASRDAPAAQQYKVLTDVRRAMFDAVYWSGGAREVVEFASDMSSQLGRIVCDGDVILSDLFALMQHDDYTYTHCINVCTYALLLAKHLGLTDSQELAVAGRGAMLHDVGKRKIDLAVLNKPGRLTPEERTIMEEHALLGFDELVLRGDIGWGPLMMIYQHHERMDGEGYPVGVPGPEIHPWARICAIADVFHALTSRRPYRSPMSYKAACAYIDEHSGAHLDGDMVKCWTTMLMTEFSSPN